MHSISILGSTGSIGTQTLEVAAACGIPVAALTARSNVDLLEAQARQFHPKLVAAADFTAAASLAQRLSDTDIQVLAGEAGLLAAAALPQADTVVAALVGIAGLDPTLAAIDAGKRIALANKETLVCAGPLVMARAKEKGELHSILLTASGGPFFGWTREQRREVTPAHALKHPNWSMGAKVTIDSATLMNKGLELLEAMSLFQVPAEKIKILVHRESIVHSAVEYCDGSVLAQMGEARRLDLLGCGPLHFAPPDLETFRCLALAIAAAKEGGTAPAILNGANEVAVAGFLEGKLGFLDIPRVVEAALDQVAREPLSLEAVHRADHLAREAAQAALDV